MTGLGMRPAGPGMPASRFWLMPVLLLAATLGLVQTLPALEIKGEAYSDLKDVAGRLGMDTRWIEKGRQLRLESDWTRMDFEVHKRELTLNGMRLHLGFPIAESRDRLHLSEGDYNHLLVPILTPQVLENVPRLRHIMIDAGHGGNDPGARNEGLGLMEKSLTLDLAKRLEKRLKAHGYRTSLTRKSDVFIPLAERGVIANRSGADLFLSLHFNAAAKPEVSGVETYAFTPPDQPSTARTAVSASDRKRYPADPQNGWSTLLGYYVQRSLKDAMPSVDRGLKRARFTVLRDLAMPGVLIEGGFVSHDREGRNIGSAAYRDQLADAIVEGILVYQRSLDRLGPSAP